MQKKVNVFLHRQKQYSNEYTYSAYPYDMGQYGYVLVGQKEVTFSLPDENTMILNEINTLKARAEKIKLEAYQENQEIEEKIQSLLSIEFKAE